MGRSQPGWIQYVLPLTLANVFLHLCYVFFLLQVKESDKYEIQTLEQMLGFLEPPTPLKHSYESKQKGFESLPQTRIYLFSHLLSSFPTP